MITITDYTEPKYVTEDNLTINVNIYTVEHGVINLNVDMASSTLEDYEVVIKQWLVENIESIASFTPELFK